MVVLGFPLDVGPGNVESDPGGAGVFDGVEVSGEAFGGDVG
ncbi:Uncharacterised protein [Dermatophilus congolensis]|uniref:Uncharacterized protein n=1 Tax=Dermatophilus congolensis TaxID=1863 RepID=A0AA46BNT6_9MICO|nr:Uncharacterised protein [Dermatophilus congolensis]